jgi:Glucose inhibited division protein A
MEVIVIGAGPAGLAAAHAAAGLDCKVRIIAPKKKTPQRGPIFLQRPIPGISTDHPQGYIRQIVIGGSILDYKMKLYGDVNVSVTSDGILREGIHTWCVREAYDTMWRMYEHLIENKELDPSEVKFLKADLVVSTAPVPRLCLRPAWIGRWNNSHRFESVPVALYFVSSYPRQPDNTIIYNAREEPLWVRSSCVFGNETTEYKVEDTKNPDLIIHKPLSTNCDCHPHVLRAGRFGEWSNMAWIDSAYYKTRTAIYSMLHQHEWDSVT